MRLREEKEGCVSKTECMLGACSMGCACTCGGGEGGGLSEAEQGKEEGGNMNTDGEVGRNGRG